MADTLTPAQRSKRMSLIRSANTRPEIAIRKALHAMGFWYRLSNNKLPGKPDIVFPRYRTVVFVHGCFWHRHSGCKIATMPKSNTEFWKAKFERNVQRDALVREKLKKMGWKVEVVWECELSPKNLGSTVKELASAIRA